VVFRGSRGSAAKAGAAGELRRPAAPTKAKEAQVCVAKGLYASLTASKIKHASAITLSLHLVQASYNLSVVSSCLILY